MTVVNRDYLIVIIISSLIFLFLAVIVIGVLQGLKNLLSRFDKQRLEKVSDRIMDYILSERDDAPLLPLKSRKIQNYILGNIKNLTGVPLSKATELYLSSGYLTRDLKELYSCFFRKRLNALSNIKTIKKDLPKKVSDSLLKDKYDAIRWSTMEHVVNTKKGKALFEYLQFLSNSKNQVHPGLAIHLFRRLAEYDNLLIEVLLRNSPDDKLTRIFLKVLEASHSEQTVNYIFENINSDSNKEFLVSALKIMNRYPTSKSYNFAKQLIFHPDWEVRVFAARHLKSFSSEDSVSLLSSLLDDESDLVIKEVVLSLISISNHESNRVLSEIYRSPQSVAYMHLKNESTVLQLQSDKE